MRGKCQRLRPMKFAPMLFWVTTTYKLLKTVATVDSTSMLRTAAQHITLFAKNTQVWDLQCWCGKVRQRLDASRPGGRHTCMSSSSSCMSASVKVLSTSYIDVPAWPLYTTWNNCVKYCLKNDSAALSSLSRSVANGIVWMLDCAAYVGVYHVMLSGSTKVTMSTKSQPTVPLFKRQAWQWEDPNNNPIISTE